MNEHINDIYVKKAKMVENKKNLPHFSSITIEVEQLLNLLR